ncbi:MAG: hypothetical protein U0946_05690 [Patescibacteria group bacterium]|nr:hypothetical protein [Patescibacteria group bacterium]
MVLNTISTKQLRENFDWVLQAMANNQPLTLLYRSKPLAEIKPLPQAKTLGRNFSQTQINQWLKDDQLTKKQQQKINALINRLP